MENLSLDRGTDISKESIIINQESKFDNDVTRLINIYYLVSTGFLETYRVTLDWSVHEERSKSNIRTVY